MFKGCVTAGVLGPLLGVAQACVSAAKDALNAAVNNLADPGPPPEAALDPVDQLKQLHELREQGILTEEEFSAEKKKLLGI